MSKYTARVLSDDILETYNIIFRKLKIWLEFLVIAKINVAAEVNNAFTFITASLRPLHLLDNKNLVEIGVKVFWTLNITI